MLSNAYFLAKFCFDTAENEPAKNSQNFRNFAIFANIGARSSPVRRHTAKETEKELAAEGGGRRANGQKSQITHVFHTDNAHKSAEHKPDNQTRAFIIGFIVLAVCCLVYFCGRASTSRSSANTKFTVGQWNIQSTHLGSSALEFAELFIRRGGA